MFKTNKIVSIPTEFLKFVTRSAPRKRSSESRVFRLSSVSSTRWSTRSTALCIFSFFVFKVKKFRNLVFHIKNICGNYTFWKFSLILRIFSFVLENRNSTTGSAYYVRVLSTLNRESLTATCSVALHRYSFYKSKKSIIHFYVFAKNNFVFPSSFIKFNVFVL